MNYSNVGNIVTFAFFFHKTIHLHSCNICVCQVVWSVATVPASDWAVDLTAEGSLQYKTVTINIGGVWSHTRNAAIITVPGIYYTVANIDISCSHIIATFWLKVNGENVFEIQPSSRIDSGQTRNNGAVIRLDEGDNVNVVLWLPLSASCYYINSDASASFFGLLLSPYIYA